MGKFNELKIVEEYVKGSNTKELALKYNTYNTSIRRILIRHKIPLISTSERLRFVKSNPFKENDIISDYFLGLLIADGCISTKNTITLGLKEEDVYMLRNFALFCGDLVKVTSYFHKGHNKLQYQVSFKQKEVVEWLQTKANFQNKSYDSELYTPLNWNILRGLSDGDGCFHIDKSNNLIWDLASGSKTILLQVQDFLLKHNINSAL